MILIAESGSTKCNWVILTKDGTQSTFSTCGINPYFNDKDFIVAALSEQSVAHKYALEIRGIYYFGAGSTDEQLKSIISFALEHFFPNVEHISCESDLNAAALATGNGAPAIVSILGTGANTAFFDGKKLQYEKPALGYILGDEASGAYFGKQLLRYYLYKELPVDLQRAFEEKYGLTKQEALINIYQRPSANAYVASFMPFLIDHQNHPFMNEILRKGFVLFLKTHVLNFEYKKYPLNLVGSVAHYGQKILREEAQKIGIDIGMIVQRPIDKLVEYYRNQLL